MAYDINLADRIREYLSEIPNLNIIEKKMFGGLAFLVDEKMCVNVSGDNLMLRYNPDLEEEVSSRIGFLPMIMKGKQMDGFCYVEPEGFRKANDFNYWMKISLEYNKIAKKAKKK
ncbi:TfoX/Sxy family protein [Soonwooa sp.]|uniref:TfoX/Sxy family protein n=1 Tax=Soonwooa sp. TaxID=1938592 RepID=UPI0026341C6E|nr:TfoX/Sxy family protein [Soonwooa sp.]